MIAYLLILAASVGGFWLGCIGVGAGVRWIDRVHPLVTPFVILMSILSMLLVGGALVIGGACIISIAMEMSQ